MEQPKQIKSRRKFLVGSAAILGAIALLKCIPLLRRKQVTSGGGTVKMLTRDGILVEIDKSLLSASAGKISNEELQNWIKNKPAQNLNDYGKQ